MAYNRDVFQRHAANTKQKINSTKITKNYNAHI